MKKFAVIREDIVRLIFGSAVDQSLERKIQIILTFVSSVQLLLGIVYCIVAEMSIWLLVLNIAAAVAVVTFYFIARNSAHYQRSILPLFFLSTFFLSAAWLLNGGYDGNITTLMFVYFLLLYVIMQQRFRLVVFITFLTMISLLVSIQYFFPQYVLGYHNEEQRFGDMIISNLMYLILYYTFIDVIIKYYVQENTKFARINEDLIKKNEVIAEKNSQLKESEEKFRQITQSTIDIIFTFEQDGTLLFVSDSVELILGYAPSEVIGRSLSDFVPGQERSKIDHWFNEIFGMRTVAGVVSFCSHRDGRHIDAEFNGKLVQTNGRPIAQGTIRDITERMRSEQRIREMEQMLNRIINLLPVRVFWKDRELNYLGCNDIFAKDAGRSHSAELLGRNDTELTWRDQAELYRADDREIIATAIPKLNFVEPQTTPDGSTIWLKTSKVPLTGPDGSTIGILGVYEDITESKTAEEALRQSEQKFHELYSLQRLMSDTMPDMIWAKDLEKRYIFVNNAICEKLLIASDTSEPIGKTDLYFAERQRALRPEDPQWHTFGELCQDSDTITVRELREMQFDEFGNVEGKFLFLDVRKAPLFDNTGKLIGIVGTARDVTIQKRIEETLQLSYHSLESISEFITVTDLEDRFTYVNQAFLDAYGFTRDEIIGRTPSIIWSPNNHDGLIHDILAHSRTGGWRGEVLNITKNGREFLVSLSTSQVRDKDGTIIALAGISKDITEQKHAEERLQVSEERQRFILDSMPVAIYSSPLDPEIDTAWIGGDVKKVTGYTVEEYLSQPDFWRSRLHPDDVETVRNTYRSITLDHEAILEYRWKCRDGEYHWFQERTTLKQKKEQKEFLGIIIDITERKEMVRALQENESRYRSIVENLHQAYYEADSRAVFTYCNPELYLMTGFTEKDLIGSSALRLVAPEDRPVISDSYRTWKEEKREYSSIEFMAQMKNGEKYWMEQTTHFEFDEQGRFVKGTNIVKNIQKRKEAEAALLKSEIFFRSVWQHSASGMRITDLDGIVINTNKAYCDMVGIPESELIGAPFSVIYAEEERSRIIQKHRERFAGGNIPPFMQKKLRLWNGNIIWVEVSNSFVEFGGGQTLLLGVFTDITHRKQSELALLESEERWQFALEGAGDGVWDWNCVTNEVLFSHNWKAMLGYSDDEISSNLDEWSKRIHQDDLKRVTEALTHCLNKETQYYQSEHRMLCKDGTYKWVLDRGKVIEWGENDTPLRMIGTHANISELKKSEQIIRDLQRRESIGVLAGGIAHDFNNLLTAIIGNVSLAQLRVGKEHASVHQNLERVMSAAERAATLSKQMLAYSGKGKFQIVEIDLVKMVQDSIGLFSASLPKNVSVVKHLSPVPVFVKGDPGQIEQVVMNLIINAGEAVGTKNGVVNISVVSMSMNEESLVPYGRLNNQRLNAGEYALLQVTDTGVGMDAETLRKIFDPFFTTKFVGRGLGLSAVLGIISGHNGGITVSSEVNGGTIFQVVLPMITAAKRKEEQQQYSGINSGHSKSILVIDDEQYIIDMTKDVLDRGQYRYHTAVDPEKGVKIFADHWRSIDLVILDYSMPKMNGKEVLVELRKINPNITVIMSSGYSEEELDHLMGDIKPSVFIQKPHRPQTLLTVINTLLEGR